MSASSEATRLLPRPLLVVLTAVLCAAVLVPVAYIVLASLNSEASTM